MIRFVAFSAALVLVAGAAFAHHGWGSYDAAHPVTVVGPIVTSKFENPHATITVRGTDSANTQAPIGSGSRPEITHTAAKLASEMIPQLIMIRLIHRLAPNR